MTVTVEAVYENGCLHLKEPLALAAGTLVRVTITPVSDDDPLAGMIGTIDAGRSDGADNHDKYIAGKRRP